MRAADLRGCPAFAKEAGGAGRIGRQMRVHPLEGDALAQPDVLGLVDRRHRPLSDLTAKDVLPDPIACPDGRHPVHYETSDIARTAGPRYSRVCARADGRDVHRVAGRTITPLASGSAPRRRPGVR